MLEAKLAQKFVEQIVQYIEYNINIMDEHGCIIASRDPSRIGSFHDVAYQIMAGGRDSIVIYGENEYPRVKPGINLVLNVDGQRMGVVGVTGNPDEIKPVAQIVKVAVEAMLRYEKQQAEQWKRQSKKERLADLLLYEEFADPVMVRNTARELKYTEEIPRIPILCVFSLQRDAEEFLKYLKKGSCHSGEEISFAPEESRIVLFKTFTQENECADVRSAVDACLGEAIDWMRRKGAEVTCFVGSVQNNFTQYYYGYQHCIWLERHVKESKSIVYFYDHAEQYLHDLVPAHEMRRMFAGYEAALGEAFLHQYTEVIGALMQANWSLTAAARVMYMHKNTLQYQYGKIKDRLGMNPMEAAADRQFMETFYYYLKTKH